jgi:hypothetical protein
MLRFNTSILVLHPAYHITFPVVYKASAPQLVPDRVAHLSSSADGHLIPRARPSDHTVTTLLLTLRTSLAQLDQPFDPNYPVAALVNLVLMHVQLDLRSAVILSILQRG